MEIERKTSLFFGLSNLSRLLDGWLAGIDWFPKLKSSEREINVVWWCGGMRTVKMSPPRQILWSSVPVLAFPHADTRLMDFKFCTPSINCYRRRQPFFLRADLAKHSRRFPANYWHFLQRTFCSFSFSISISNEPRISCKVNEFRF